MSINRSSSAAPAEAMEGFAKMPEALAQLGYTSLRPGQEDPINSIMFGRDTICVLPTGGGKTCIALLPTICMGWRTIIFSPLISLMRDQEQSMNRVGIAAGSINSAKSESENWQILQEWAKGRLQVMLVAPERIPMEHFKQVMSSAPPSLVVADEAHTISQWGQSFRPAYQRIGEFIDTYNPKVVLAMTATATSLVIDDIKKVCRIPNACVCRSYPPRANLHLSSSECSNDEIKERVLKLVQGIEGSCIVYCQTKTQISEITSYLNNMLGDDIVVYHGDLKDHERAINQDAFMSGEKRICVATNAFGMGIDKPDIRGIIHVGPPGSVESIVQEIGRASRDGKDAACHMLVSPSTIFIQEFLWSKSNPSAQCVRKVYDYLRTVVDQDNVAKMTAEAIAKEIGETEAASALNFLQARGCVERFTPMDKIAIFTIHRDKVTPDNPKGVAATIYEAIINGITVISEDGDDITGALDLNWLASCTGRTDNSNRPHIRTMVKAGILDFTPPYVGKCTRLITPPSLDDLIYCDERRKIEHRKLEQARAYATTDSADKHKFIQDYFELT